MIHSLDNSRGVIDSIFAKNGQFLTIFGKNFNAQSRPWNFFKILWVNTLKIAKIFQNERLCIKIDFLVKTKKSETVY